VGNARTALLNWLFARHTGGRFILRIEDTDVERSQREYERALLEDLRWLGLNWDEGPDVGGPLGPYRQSERLHLYQEYAQRLLKEGRAYPCYCTEEELKEKSLLARARGETPRYDGHCRTLTEAEKRRLEAEGRKPVIRFYVPEEEIVEFHDLIRGLVRFEGRNIGDFVILRSDGIATYNFAVVVDDFLMEISHVIRGEDHVSNTPKQILIYRALGFSFIPKFAHVPMILGYDRTPLSKRHGATSLQHYREKGYLPEAMVNFLSLLSWSSKSGEEILSADRLIREFDFSRMSKSGAIFNVEKLNWMNGWYIRHTDLDRLTELVMPYLAKAGFPTEDRPYIRRIVDLIRDHLEYLEQIVSYAKIFFQDQVSLPNNLKEVVQADESQKVFQRFLHDLPHFEEWTAENFGRWAKEVQNQMGIRGKDFYRPLRIALTGQEHGPELPKIVELLGRERCKKFIENVLEGRP